MKLKIFIIFSLIIFTSSLGNFACKNINYSFKTKNTLSQAKDISSEVESSLLKIWRTRKITVIMENNAHDNYMYHNNNQPVDFEYELVKAFADYLKVDLEIITPRCNNMIKLLNSGKGDLIAAGFCITPLREKIVDFSKSYLSVQQKIILHRENRCIKRVEDLSGKAIHVTKGSSYHERLLELKKYGLDIELVLHDETSTKELIGLVAEKEIEITVANSHIAQLNQRYHPDIVIAFPIAEMQLQAWAVREGDKKLLSKINKFFNTVFENGTFDSIYTRYYSNNKTFDYLDLKKFHKRIKTRLPKYEKVIKKEAAKYGFDWALIAAVIYQESHFNPRAKSYTGVRGLMQLTLGTAREMGVKNRLDPVQSIRGGVKYLNKMQEKFKSIESPDRLLFALASYNIGYKHVEDARKLACQRGLDIYKWSSLEKCLPLLRQKKYYRKTRYGYARGTEPVCYVNRILNYYDILKNIDITLNTA